MTNRITYHQATDGEWIRVTKRGFRDMCCDCGLVHVVDFRDVGGALEVRSRRDRRATAAARRGGTFKKRVT